MKNYIVLFLLLVLASCSYQNDSGNRPITSSGSYDDQSVRQIIGFMEILDTDPEYPMIYDILSRSEKPCIGKDFVGYRDCFIDNLATEQGKYSISERLKKKLFLLDWGLKDERSFTGFYQDIDNLPPISAQDFSGSCHIAGYRIFDNASFTGEHFTISFLGSQEELLKLLSNSKKLSPQSLSGVLNHENPCEFHTWGPDVGNIFYFRRVGMNNYLFVKTSDGGGSGDFNYTVYYNPQGKNNLYMEIITLPAFSGYTPIPQTIRDNQGNEVGTKHRSILEDFKNKPFQYITTMENARIGYIGEIRDELRELTPEVVYD